MNAYQFRKTLCESVVHDLFWHTATKGRCECPGAHLHSDKHGLAMFDMDRLRLLCRESKCEKPRGVVEQLIKRRVRQSEAGSTRQGIPSGSDSAFDQQVLFASRMAQAAAHLSVVRQDQVSVADWMQRSPNPVGKDPHTDWRRILNLFPETQVVWMGYPHQSGRKVDRAQFKEAGKWVKDSECPGPFLCPAHLTPGAYARHTRNALFSDFFVVHSSYLNSPDFGAVIDHCANELDLITIVEAEGRLYAWFLRPFDQPSDFIVKIRAFFAGMQCEETLLKFASITPTPGWAAARLVYLNSELAELRRRQKAALVEKAHADSQQRIALLEMELQKGGRK